MSMTIWIDGDACPKVIKAIIFKAAIRTKTTCHFVANHFSALPRSPFIKRVLVEQGFDKADDMIAERVQEKDIVVTGDLPLAEACLKKKANVISPRGKRFDSGTIMQQLAMRDFNETMRGSELHTGGPAAMNERDVQQFANQLDRLLQRGY